MEYEEEDFLQLSGVQHFLFCRRQWALIHVENQWAENEKTLDGQFFHKNAHDSLSHEKRGDVLITRGMYIHSRRLGLSGQCDIVEFHRDEHGVPIHGQEGLWKPYPIEYKRGRQKSDSCDGAQVCAQAMCLEEMYCCEIEEGALYYGENRRRQEMTIDASLRKTVEDAVKEMHEIYQRGTTPRVHRKKGCQSCSLADICLPELEKTTSVNSYLTQILEKQ